MTVAFPHRLVIASANPHKAEEIREIMRAELDGFVELIDRPESIPDIEETGTTLEENALIKARAICRETGLSALADDSGLEVDVLDGAPGVYSARYGGPSQDASLNLAKLLLEMSGSQNRRARFRTVAVVSFESGAELLAVGTVEGSIALAPKGAAGFGYDPVFVPDGADGKTFAELSRSEKHALSHRGRALRDLADQLRRALGPREAD